MKAGAFVCFYFAFLLWAMTSEIGNRLGLWLLRHWRQFEIGLMWLLVAAGAWLLLASFVRFRKGGG